MKLLAVLLSFAAMAQADYVVKSMNEEKYGWSGALTLSEKGPYGNDIQNLALDVWFETDERLRVSLRDADADRWEVPDKYRLESFHHPDAAPVAPLYKFVVTSQPNEKFSFQVVRKETGTVLFDTSIDRLVYSNQYIEFSTALPSRTLNSTAMYGFGERIVPLRLQKQDYVIWNTDWGNPDLLNLYGHHPLYQSIESSGHTHGVVLYNSNMMDGQLQDDRFTYRTIGGIIDLWFFLGPSPLEVIDEYTQLIGRPFMPPLWSIGWHQCRWGYNSANTTFDVVKNYTKFDLPLDAIWNDIDWMNDYIFGTWGPDYGVEDTRALNDHLERNHQKHVQIVDPNVPALLEDKNQEVYHPYVDGKKAGIFVRHPANDTILYGKQWPAVTVTWPDFTHPDVEEWWYGQFVRFGEIAGQMGGIWLDMNEPSSFCAGQITASCIGVNDTSRLVDPEAVPHVPGSWPTDLPYPPYQPGASSQKMEDHSFNISSHHYIGQHYNVKDLYGYTEQIAAARVMERVHKERAFTLSRSTFMGSGAHGAHWLGDNNSQWPDLRKSIAEVLSMGIYGIPMIGADICGFGGDTTDELCARWIQLGALYPFSRSHSSTGTRRQEPYEFGPVYNEMNRNSLKLRYSMLPYFYQLFINAHRTGAPVWRAMYMEFTKDPETWSLDTQFMLGPAILGIPVLEQSSNHSTGYLPNEDWFNFHTFERIATKQSSGAGQMVNFTNPIEARAVIPLLQRGGHTVPRQQPKRQTYETIRGDFTLQIALNDNGESRGFVVLDDGVTIGNVARGEVHEISHETRLALQSKQVQGTVRQSILSSCNYDISHQYVEKIVIMGLAVNDVGQVGRPSLTVEGKNVSLKDVKWTVERSAIVANLMGLNILPISKKWELTFGSNTQPQVQLASE